MDRSTHGLRVELIAHRAGNSVDLLAGVVGVADTVEIDAHYDGGEMRVRHAKQVLLTRRHWERWYLLPRDQVFPHLVDIIDAADPELGLWIDCKGVSPRLPKAAMEIIGDRRPLTASSKSWWLMSGFGRYDGVRKIRSAGNKFELFLMRKMPSRAPLDGVVLHQRLLTGPLVAELKSRFGSVFSWAIEDVETARRLADWGVDGLIIDDVELIGRIAAEAREVGRDDPGNAESGEGQ